MSMLGEQIKELREAARNIQGNLGRCLYRRKDVDEMQRVSGMLFEAADTIENLRNRLQEEDDALRDYRASQIAAEAERRLREIYGKVPEQAKRGNDGKRESYDAGFENGVKATLRQLDELIVSGYDLKAVCSWINNRLEGEAV